MKITRIETLPVDHYLFVRVHTDAGITGLGESGAWGYLEASEAAVRTFERYLIGQDPLRIEHHWQYLYRWTHFRGAAFRTRRGSVWNWRKTPQRGIPTARASSGRACTRTAR